MGPERRALGRLACRMPARALLAALAMLAAAAPGTASALELGGEGRGTPVAVFPSPGAIASAASFLAGRAGRTSFAVVDSTGRLTGLRTRERFETASVVKVMLLMAYLQMLRARHRGLDGGRSRAALPDDPRIQQRRRLGRARDRRRRLSRACGSRSRA